MSSVKINIVSGFPGGIEKKLLKKICKDRNKNRRGKNFYLHVLPFERFGFSGAKLYLIYFNKRPVGNPFLVKINTKKKIRKEFNAIDSMRDLVSDCHLEENKMYTDDDIGALLYAYKGEKEKGEVSTRTFREVLYSKESEFPIEDLKNILIRSYEKLKGAHNLIKFREVKIETKYEPYFRDYSSDEKIKSILGAKHDDASFNFLSTEIYNPLKYIRQLQDNIKIPVSRVHGDFHPDNIILDGHNNPSLIDFAWAEIRRDIYVDFVLPECSIRFKDFPKDIDLATQLKVDKKLLEENKWGEIDESISNNTEISRRYKRQAEMVGIIRKRAKHVLGDRFDIKQYLFAQFIVLYGVLQYNSYDQQSATRALGMICKRLNELGYGTKG